jgi:hypothetical protein
VPPSPKGAYHHVWTVSVVRAASGANCGDATKIAGLPKNQILLILWVVVVGSGNLVSWVEGIHEKFLILYGSYGRSKRYERSEQLQDSGANPFSITNPSLISSRFDKKNIIKQLPQNWIDVSYTVNAFDDNVTNTMCCLVPISSGLSPTSISPSPHFFLPNYF